MLGNPYKADLLQERLDTLEIMKQLAFKYKTMPEGEAREAIEQVIKGLGVVSQEYTRMIAQADPMPEKWVTYYQVREQFYGRH